MSEMTLWVALLGGEILLVLFVLLFVSWLRNSSARRRDNKAVNNLIASIRKSKPERENAIAAFLGNNMGLQGEALEKYKVKLMREEMRLMQGFADIYRKRDAVAAGQFFLTAEPALDAYHDLTGGGQAEAAVVGDVDTAELEALRKENARLSEELSVTMDTMSRMLNEYSTMFSSAGQSTEETATAPESTVVPATDAPAEARDVPTLDETELDIGEADETGLETAVVENEVQGGFEDVVEEVAEPADDTLALTDVDELVGPSDQSPVLEIGEDSEDLLGVADDELVTGVDDLDALFDGEDEAGQQKREPDESIAI